MDAPIYKPKYVTQGPIKIIGKAWKTTNQKGQAARDIPKFWDSFYKENVLLQIPNRIDESVLGVYTDYVGDFTKPYTILIGCPVSSLDDIPEGLEGKNIARTTYAVFEAKGSFPQCLVDTWNHIWNSGLERAYRSDFEVYGPKFGTPENAHVDVYISIKR